MSFLGFIGGGAMAEAIIKGLLKKGKNPQHILVSDISKDRLSYLKSNLGVLTAQDNKEVADKCEMVVLSVKPQNMSNALESIRISFDANKILVSILAGISTAKIEELLFPGVRVIRAMPNTPALIGAGITVLAAGKTAGDKELETAREIFESVGAVKILPEKLLNAVTGLSGSGPAYVYLIIEALADGGVMAGLPRDTALELAASTVMGAAGMVKETGMHPAQLKDKVTSPGGTTIYGLLQLEKNGVRGSIMETVLAAVKRSEEMK